MKCFISIILLSIVFSCKNNPDNTLQEKDKTIQIIDTSIQIIDFGIFQIKTPKGWQKIELKGIDSYVGGLTNSIDTLIFDFGQYSSDLTENAETQVYSNDTINGKFGVVTKPKIIGSGILGVYFDNIDGKQFNLYTTDSKNEDAIILIFQTIKFKTSDTTENSKKLKFEEKEF